MITNKNNSNFTTTVSQIKPTECFKTLKSLLYSQPKYDTLVFDSRAWLKLNCYCYLVGNLEVTGFGKIEGDTITDIKILKQVGKSAEVEVDEEAQMVFMRSIKLEDMDKWILDWHSHVEMGAFMSTTDTTNYDSRYEVMKTSFPAMVVNKKQEIYCKEWFGNGVCGSKLNIEIPSLEDISEEEFKAIYEECYTDVENLVQRATTVYKYPAESDYSDWQFKSVGNKFSDRFKNKKPFHRCSRCGDELGYETEIRYGICTGCMTNEQLMEVQQEELETMEPTEIAGSNSTICSFCGENYIDSDDEVQVENGMCGECLEKYTREIY